MCSYAPPNFYVKSKIITNSSHDFQQIDQAWKLRTWRLFPSKPFLSESALTPNTSILNNITLVFYWKLVLTLLVQIPQCQSSKLQLSALQSHKLPFLQRSAFSANWYISQLAIHLAIQQRHLLILLSYWLDNISTSLSWPK